MKSHVQIITTPTSDTPGTAIVLFFDDRRYIFGNVHEGLQRAGLEFGVKFLKTKDIFLTGRTEWNTNGGLLGLILTLTDAVKAAVSSKADTVRLKQEKRRLREEAERQDPKKGKKKDAPAHPSKPTGTKESQLEEENPSMRIHGGPNLTHVMATARSFIFRQGMPISVDEFNEEEGKSGDESGWEPTWADERVQVWAMPIRPSTAGGFDSTRKTLPSRKRSLNDYMQGQRVTKAGLPAPWDSISDQPEGQEDSDQKIRQSVVNEMFQSEWRLDKLVETPLYQVILPAKMFVRDPVTKHLVPYTGPRPDGTRPVPDINVLVRQPWPGGLIENLPPTKSSRIAISYIIRNHRQRGRFRPEDAIKHNVPKGPLWAQLTMGNSVQSSDGKTITSDMVLEPGREGVGVAIIDLPTKEYVQDLIHRPEWKAERVIDGVGAIIWLLGPGVIDDPSLLTFIDEHKDLKHVVSSVDACPNYLAMNTAAAESLRHNLIDPMRYPLLKHDNACPAEMKKVAEGEAHRSWIPAERGLKIELMPNLRLADDDLTPVFDPGPVRDHMPRAVLRRAREAQAEIQSERVQAEIANQDLPSPDSEIICLGTGSALPSKHRNVSATLLRVPGHGSYLFDCGESTLGQLKRIYSPSELEEVFNDLKIIWISHLHADHHLGTASVIKAWYETVHGKDTSKRPRISAVDQFLNPVEILTQQKRLCLISTSQMMRWLKEYSCVEDIGYDHLTLLECHNQNLRWNGVDAGFHTTKDPRIQSAIRQATSLSDLQTCFVSHCHNAKAISITFPTGFKFSYSGDCRPSENFVRIGQGSTVLLHEATFDDDLIGDAKAKKHSTTSEAIGVGVAMGARRILLTHFSQRYNKIPTMEDLDRPSIKLVGAEDVDESAIDVDVPVDIQDDTDVQPPVQVNDSESPIENPTSSNQTNRTDPTAASTVTENLHSPKNTDLKVAVAFDYMRVLVKDIAHLEKFTPALRELYKDEERAFAARKANTTSSTATSRKNSIVGDDSVAAGAGGKRRSRVSPDRAEKSVGRANGE